MPRTPVLSASQQTGIQNGRTAFDQYVLTCPNTVVFACQINEDLSANTNTAQFTYDSVSTGAYTAALVGFTVYVSRTNDISASYWQGRVRSTPTASILYINQTSAALQDDDYIFVVKDVKAQTRLGRAISTAGVVTYYKDYDIAFRLLLPSIIGLQTVYVGVLDGSGNADIALAASGQANENGAAISSYLWDLDGGALPSGALTDASITVRYTSAGHYMPRITVTDDGGRSNWFSPHVFIVPADYNGTINRAFNNASISCQTGIGWTASITADVVNTRDALAQIDTLLDETFVAIWTPTTKETYTSDIVMCGRFRKETITHNIDRQVGRRLSTTFDIEGIGGQLQRIVAQKVPMVYDTTPTSFGYVDSLTPYRAIMYYLTEYTTVTNCHTISFDAFDNTYLSERLATNDGNVLSAIEDILFTINGGIEHYATGEIYIARKAWYQTTAARNALDSIADLTMTDIQVSGAGGTAWSIVNDYALKVAKEVSAGGWYSTTTNTTSVLKMNAPAVAPTTGSANVVLNRQVLTANVGSNGAAAELGQRTANDFAARQPQTVITAPLLDGFSFIQPSVSQWYTWTITSTDNNRGISYTTANRWTLTAITVGYADGRRTINGTWLLETSDSDYNQLVAFPPNAQPYYFNVPPVTATYPNFPEPESNNKADPSDPDINDELPFEEDDVAPVNDDNNPGAGTGNNTVPSGTYLIVWSSTQIWRLDNVFASTTPAASDRTPYFVSSGDYTDIQDVKFNRMANTPTKALVAAINDGTDSRIVSDIFGIGGWASVGGVLGGIWSKIRSKSTSTAYAYTEDMGTYDGSTNVTFDSGGGDYVFDDFNESGTRVFDPSSLTTAPAGSISGGNCALGTATVAHGTDWWTGCFVKIEFSQPVTVTDVTFQWRYNITAAPARNVLRAVSYYDSNDVRVDTTNVQTNLSENSWRSQSFTYSVSSVSYIWVFIRANSVTKSSIEGSYWIDDIDVTAGASGVAVVTMTPDVNKFGAPLRDSGISLQAAALATPAGGLDMSLFSDFAFAAIDEKVQDNTGGSWADTTNGGITGEEPQCIWNYGTTEEAFLMASSALVSNEGLWKVDSGGKTDITPYDGSHYGLGVSSNCIAMPDGSLTIVMYLATFNATVKLAYSTDLGATWAYNTQVGASANYVRVYRSGAFYYVYVSDGTTLWISEWSGSGTLTLIARNAPGTIIGVEAP